MNASRCNYPYTLQARPREVDPCTVVEAGVVENVRSGHLQSIRRCLLDTRRRRFRSLYGLHESQGGRPR